MAHKFGGSSVKFVQAWTLVHPFKTLPLLPISATLYPLNLAKSLIFQQMISELFQIRASQKFQALRSRTSMQFKMAWLWLAMVNNLMALAPVVMEHPESQMISEGETAILRVVVDVSEPLSYVWKKDGSVISSATESALTIPAAQAVDAGRYTVEVTNSDGSCVAGPAAVFVGSKRILRVKSNANGGNNGSSWNDAYTSLTTALANAQDGDEIWVAAGTYKPSTTGNRDATFNVSKFVRLLGGFAGNETQAPQRNWNANATVLSGDLSGNDTGLGGNQGDNSKRVVTVSSTLGVVIDGFTISGGHQNSISQPDYGAGVGFLSMSASATLRNCRFKWNTAISYGGAVGHFLGGATSPLTIERCEFIQNSAPYNGGGAVQIENCFLLVRDCYFQGNSGSSSGAITMNNSGGLFMANCVFVSNSAGGGMQSNVSSGALRGWSSRSANYRVHNSTFYNNTNGRGVEGAIALTTSSASGSLMANSVVVGSGNAPVTFPETSYLISDQSISGSGNVIASPSFTDSALPLGIDQKFGTADDGLSLEFGSMGMDDGYNALVPYALSTDITGQSRVTNTVDRGAYEYYDGNIPLGNVWPNYVIEADSNKDGKPDFWNKGGTNPSGCLWITEDYHSPTHCLRVVDESVESYSAWYSDLFNVNPGKGYRLAFYTKYNISSGSMRLTIQYRDGANALVSSQSIVFNAGPREWSEVIETLKVPSNAEKIRIVIVSGGAPASLGWIQLDDLSLVPLIDQMISFPTIPDQMTTNSVDLMAVGGESGNPVTFVVTAGPGVITNNVLTFTTSGSVTVTASQAGNANYLAAEDVVRSFTVTKATSTIQFADCLHIDDGSSRSVSFTTEPAHLPYELLYADSEAAPSLPGIYAVTASLEHPIHSGSGSTALTILGLSGRGQRLTSGSSQTQEANGTDFGRVLPGRVATQTFTITNPGTTPVTLTGSPLVEILGDHAGDFQVSVPPAAEIPAGSSVSFEVRFAPTQLGARQAVVSLACEALANGPISFAVGGFGALPTLLEQSISFNLPASLYLSQGPVPLIATASSGLPVTLTVLSGPATLDAGELILNGIGTVKIQAAQEGGGNFAAAKPVVRTLTVKADPTGLTLADLTQTYNGTPRPITVLGTEEEVTVTYFINKLPSDNPPTDAGSYPVTAVAGPVTKKGTLVIARAPLIVQVQDQRKLVGQPNPNLTAQVTGFIGEDNQNTVLFRPISVTTKAKSDSPPGLYPITSSGGAALNYTLIHRPGTLVVEGYVGNFEALLRDADTGLPVGLLKLTVPSTSRSASASLALADQAKPLALAGVLNLDPATRIATAQLSRAVNATTTHRLDLTLSLFGELAVEVRKNDQLIAEAEDGTRLRDAVKGESVPQMAAYTAVLEPAEDDAASSAPGWATAKVDAAGRLALTGRLGDGTPFTASLPVDVRGGYRLFVQPYKRAGAHLGGTWSLNAHPDVADTWQARGGELTWLKGDNAKDPGYRSGFGPLAVTLEMDAWQPASKTSPLAQLLGAEQFQVIYDPTGSPSEGQLPSLVALDRSNSLLVLAPVTNPVNLRKWKAKVNPAAGAYTGSFELFDLTQKRKVSFGGVLRQAVDAEADGLQGRGHYLLPALKGAPSTETTTGRIEIRRGVE